MSKFKNFRFGLGLFFGFLFLFSLIYLSKQFLFTNLFTKVNQFQNLSFFAVMGFAVLAGIFSNFSPCSLAIIPAYLSFFLGTEEENNIKNQKLSKHSIYLALSSVLGILFFYFIIGILIFFTGFLISKYIAFLKVIVIIILFILGIYFVFFDKIKMDFLVRFRLFLANKMFKFSDFLFFKSFLFGIIYAMGILSCFLPLLLPLIMFTILTAKLYSIINFLIFGLFEALFLFILIILVIYGKHHWINKFIDNKMLKRVSGVILILVAFYLLTFIL